MSPTTSAATPSDTAQQPFVYSGRPLRVYFDIKHIPLEALPALAWDIGRGGGSISENPSGADVLVVDPAHPRGFEGFLNARPADRRPPVVFAFWVPLCTLSRRLIWIGHPHWECVVFSCERPAYPTTSVGALAYGLFMAGRNCADLVPASELPGRTPRLIADAILASSQYVVQGSSANSKPSASISAQSLFSGAVSAVEAAPEPAGSSNPVAPAPVVSVLSPARPKRPGSGLKIATVGGSERKGPVDQLDRASKTQRASQSTDGSSSQPDLIEASSRKEPVAPATQPQIDAAEGGGLNRVTVLVPNETPRISLCDEYTPKRPNFWSVAVEQCMQTGDHNDMLPPAANAILAQPGSNQAYSAPEAIKNGNSHPNGSTNSGVEPVQTNGGSTTTTEPAIEALSPARPVTPLNISHTSSASRAKEITAPTSIANGPQDQTASEFDLTRSIVVPTPTRMSSLMAPVAVRNKALVLPARHSRVITATHARTPTVNGTNDNSNKPTPKQPTLSSTASSLRGTFWANPKTTNQPRSLSPLTQPPASSSPPPSPPGTPPNLKYRMEWVEEDDRFLVDYMNWYFKKRPNAPTDDILDDIIEMIPRHPPDTWRNRFRSRESDCYAFKVPELMRRMVNRTSRVNPKGPRTDDLNKVPPAPSVESILRRERNEVDYTESTDEDEPYLSSSSSDRDFVEGSQRKRRTRSEKYQEKKRPRYTM
ncbi:hypothetical protein FRC12_024812 [Ceratobasidium sp. 428]|nr:hypothetical protein FRC12_024812 [Ceratobasidium sp. 428]